MSCGKSTFGMFSSSYNSEAFWLLVALSFMEHTILSEIGYAENGELYKSGKIGIKKYKLRLSGGQPEFIFLFAEHRFYDINNSVSIFIAGKGWFLFVDEINQQFEEYFHFVRL